MREVEGEDAGRGQILDGVEPPRRLLRVAEAPVPVRLGVIGAVRARVDRRYARVRAPAHDLATGLVTEAEEGILPVQGVVVAPREERPRPQAPAQMDPWRPAGDEELLGDLDVAVDRPRPGGPGLGHEGAQARRAVRVDD